MNFEKRVLAARKEMRELFPATPLQLNSYLSKLYGAEAVSYTHLTLPTILLV